MQTATIAIAQLFAARLGERITGVQLVAGCEEHIGARRLDRPPPQSWEKIVINFEDAPPICIKVAIEEHGAQVAGFEEGNHV